MKEKILYIGSDKISLTDIPWALLELGREVEIYEAEITLQEYRKSEKEALVSCFSEGRYGIAMTYNFSPVVSDACQVSGLKYLAWVFDSPQIDIYTSAYYNPCNYIFVFDRKFVERLKPRGISHLYHMPLAANVSRVSTVQFVPEDFERFESDISFVGNLYEGNAFNSTSHLLPADIRAKMVDHIRSEAFHWEKGRSIFGLLSEEDCDKICEKFYLGEWIDIEPCYYLEVQYLTRKQAEVERIGILNALASRHRVKLYTKSNVDFLDKVIVSGNASYGTEAPKIFNLSKINLNITLRSIELGAPQRVFDIMSAGGFVLSNYQEELEELFVPDKEIVLYHDLEELIWKTEYYLSHEQERVNIAINGYRKVRDYYNYPKRLEQMLHIVEE